MGATPVYDKPFSPPKVFHHDPGYKPTGMTGAEKPQRGYHLHSFTDPNLPLPRDSVLITRQSK